METKWVAIMVAAIFGSSAIGMAYSDGKKQDAAIAQAEALKACYEAAAKQPTIQCADGVKK